MTHAFHRQITMTSPDETAQLACRLAPKLRSGDIVLLEGSIGAGKTHFARSLIQQRLRDVGLIEDVPSPTFTLVQTYDDGQSEIWHADLYRLMHTDEVEELGLVDAFDNAVCLVEWPDRLGDLQPANALRIRFSTSNLEAHPDARALTIMSDDPRWIALLEEILP